jgi:hypothetical protein
MLIWFEGAFLPVTEAGTILGNTIAPAVARDDLRMNSRLEL